MELKHVVGMNCKALRGAASMDNLAQHARQFGARWNGGNIAKIEAGTHRPTLETIMILAAALESLNEQQVGVPDLLRSGDPIDLAPGLQVANGTALAGLLGSR